MTTSSKQHASDGLPNRLLDIAASAAGLLVLAPVMGLIALTVKSSDGGPVLYRSRRVGRHGEPFAVLKFRTMVVDADRRGPAITASGDPRVTRVGRILRRTKLDELPQLMNVLRGQMSIVGPRPEDPRYVAEYTPEQRQILCVRPGITSAASLHYRHEEALLTPERWEATYVDEVLPRKIEIDLEYLSKRTLWSDVLIVLRTVFSLFK